MMAFDDLGLWHILTAAFVVFILVKLPPWQTFLNFKHTRSLPRDVVFMPPFGLSNHFVPERFRHTDSTVYRKKHKDYARHKSTAYWMVSPLSTQPCLMVADALAVQDIGSRPDVFGKPLWMYEVIAIWGGNLISTQGPEWKRHRKVVGPTFSEANNKSVWLETIRICDLWFAKMDAEMDATGADTFDDAEVMENTMLLALMVISSAGFGMKLPWDEDDSAVPAGHEMTFATALKGVIAQFLPRILTPNWMYHLPIESLKKAERFYKQFEAYMREMIEERRLALAQGVEARDLFGALIKASGEEKGAAALTETEMLSNIYVIMLAGHETTGHTLAGALLMLCLYPEHQEIIRKEAEEIFTGDEPPPYSDASQLKYTIATINETLRFFAPIPATPKVCESDTYLTVHQQDPVTDSWVPTQIFVPKGAQVRLDSNGMHYNPQYYPDPTTFRPSRFIDTEEKKWDRNAFIPFSVGSRGCIGKAFAMVEATAVLAKILLRYEVKLHPKLREEYKRREGEDAEEHIRRIYKAQFGVTLTPTGLGVSFVRRS